MEVRQPRSQRRNIHPDKKEGLRRAAGWTGLLARHQMADRMVPYLCADKWGGTTGKQDGLCNQGFQRGKRKLQKPLAVKTCGGCNSRRNSQPRRRACWTDSRGPRMYTNPPARNQHQKGPICLQVAGGVTESRQELSMQHCSLSDPSPTYNTTMQ